MALATLVAIAVGITIALQAATIGRLSSTIHPLAIALSLMLGGMLVAAMWASVQGAWADVATVARTWWWLPLGIAGWVIVGALGWTAGRLGSAQALALVVGAQLSTALAIDVVRSTVTLGPRPLVGVALTVIGTILLQTS